MTVSSDLLVLLDYWARHCCCSMECIGFRKSIKKFSFLYEVCYYIWRSKIRILNFSNILIGQANSSVPWTLCPSLGKKNSQYLQSRYLDYLGRSSKTVGSLDGFLSFSQTFALIFSPSSKVQTFHSIFR